MTINQSKSNLQVLDHPIITHKLAVLRDQDTPPALFKSTLAELTAVMSYAILQHINLADTTITTPLEDMATKIMANSPVIASILRAGNGMADALYHIIPEASMAHIGMQRDPITHAPEFYYEKYPQDMAMRQVILIDPMLATAGSAIEAATRLKGKGVSDIVFACLVAAPEGVTALGQAHPDIPIITAALDRELNEHCYILPGLGDAGDRIYNT
ncbi:MAG: uracil phosphoribosyltransferase [Candidatus Puniceispirillaceae bacterium]